ncbi:MAG TPA: tetratricopeptide repeat protein [Desulfobaccales bacterium]
MTVTGCGLWLSVLCLVGLWGCASAPTAEDLQSKAISLNDQGYQYYQESRFNVAEGKFSQALKINRLIDRRVGIAANLNNLGVIALEQGDPKKAEAYFQEALSINRELGDPAGLSETLNNLGLAYLAQGRVAEAQGAYQEALEYAQMLPPGPLLSLSLTHLGDVARVRKDYDLALSYYHRALQLDEGRKDLRGRAMRWERLGRTFVDLGDYPRASTYLSDALREYRRLQDTNGIADTLKDLTLMALAQGDRQEAALNGKLLLEIYQARGQEQEAKRLKDLFKAGKPARGPALK